MEQEDIKHYIEKQLQDHQHNLKNLKKLEKIMIKSMKILY